MAEESIQIKRYPNRRFHARNTSPPDEEAKTSPKARRKRRPARAALEERIQQLESAQPPT